MVVSSRNRYDSFNDSHFPYNYPELENQTEVINNENEKLKTGIVSNFVGKKKMEKRNAYQRYKIIDKYTRNERFKPKTKNFGNTGANFEQLSRLK